MTTIYMTKGYSQVARDIDEQSCQSTAYFSNSASLGRKSLFDDLFSVWQECNQDGWDCNDALRVEQETFLNASRFISSLPLGFPLPSVGAEPDGHLTLEWYRAPRWLFSISISPTGEIYYAGLFGSGITKGSDIFTGVVPKKILGLIQEVGMDV